MLANGVTVFEYEAAGSQGDGHQNYGLVMWRRTDWHMCKNVLILIYLFYSNQLVHSF